MSNNMWKLLVGIVIVILFVGTGLILHFKDNEKNLQYHFNGEVQNVQYDVKGIPSVTINNKTLYLSYNNWGFNRKIEKGDTLKKEKGTFRVELTKFKSGETLIFE